jgi:putative N6-adenine-specific DNA methylase
MRFLATVSKGLEEVCAGELSALGISVLDRSPGAVAFKGRLDEAWRACLWLRTGRRVLRPLGTFEACDADTLYEGVKAIRWEELLTPRTTFAVTAKVSESRFRHSGFVALKVKDAVADAMRERKGARPDVDRHDPDAHILVRVSGGTCDVSLDLSGGPLHKRGYRTQSVAAPLNETLAAGMLLLLGYDGSLPFADPFCGSGTILIEAAMIAARTPPGFLRRAPFGFERVSGFVPRAWERLLEEARDLRRAPPASLLGSDADPAAVDAARANAEAAGLNRWIRVAKGDARQFAPSGMPGLLLCNPPYGEHAGAGEDLPALYKGFGDALKRSCAGWTAGILTGNADLAKCVGLHPRRRIALYNGPMPVKLHVYELYEGSKKASR